MKLWFLLLLVVLTSWTLAFSKPPLSAESRLVQVAYVALKANPASARAQLNYLLVFPKSKAKFLRIFMDSPTYGQLCDGHDYIEALRRLGKTYPTKVLGICLGVEKRMARTSDAVAYIANVTVEVGIAHPQVFADETKRLTAADQIALCRFLADEEAIEDDENYSQLIKLLRRDGEMSLSTNLQQAKVRRMRQPNH